MPSMCLNQFIRIENEFGSKKDEEVLIQNEDQQPCDILEIGHEENYFVRLEKIREYEKIQMLIKAERKERAIWNLNQSTYENEDEDQEKAMNEQRRSALSAKLRESINIITKKEKQRETIDEEDTDEEEGVWNDITTTSVANNDYLHSISDEFKYIKTYRDVEINEEPFNYKFKYHIELIFIIDNYYDTCNLFHKLSVLIQDYVSERLDANDCTIARDIENNFIKIELVKKFSSSNSIATPTIELNNKILIDFKCINMKNVENLKLTFSNLIEILFSYYPGITYLKQVYLTNL